MPLEKGDNMEAKLILRRSQGESGSTAEQLSQAKPKIKELLKEKKIKKLDFNIVGKDIDKKRRFTKADLELKGDVFNEGEGQTGFKKAGREVLMEAIRRAREKAPEPVVFLVLTMDRLGRDYGEIASLMYDDWTYGNIRIYDLTTGQGFGFGDKQEEAVLNTMMTWGGIAKLGEIKKSIDAGEAKINRGYLGSSKSIPELIGSGTKNAGLDYRKASEVMRAHGFYEKNGKRFLNDSVYIGSMFGKDNKWAQRWARKFEAFEELGVLETYLKNIEAMNAFILAEGGYPRNAFKADRVKSILASSTGWFSYPAGVNPSDKLPIAQNEFIEFPEPLSIGLEILANNHPKDIEEFKVIRTPINNEQKLELNEFQTQRRAR
jgi:hypothetical protein